MEGYIKRINERVLKKNDLPKAKKIKTRYRIVGGVILGAGLAGLIACIIAFAVHFVGGDTEMAFQCWMIAIPFLILSSTSGNSVTRRFSSCLILFSSLRLKNLKFSASE